VRPVLTSPRNPAGPCPHLRSRKAVAVGLARRAGRNSRSNLDASGQHSFREALPAATVVIRRREDDGGGAHAMRELIGACIENIRARRQRDAALKTALARKNWGVPSS